MNLTMRPPTYRILFNWDGTPDGYSEYPQSLDQLLDIIYAPLVDTQVGALFWCLGAEEAKLFASEGAKVVLGDVLEEEGVQIEQEIKQKGGQAKFVKLDVTEESEWDYAVKSAIGLFGKLDILVNNAGVSGAQWGTDLTQIAWDSIMDVNATGVYLGIKVAIPAMRDAGGGSIINISSQMGIVGANSSHPAYQASKGSVRILTKSIAIQYAKDNIRCNSVHPGPIDTPMTEGLYSDEDIRESQISKIPMGRRGTSEEVAPGVLYLASDESSYVTGAELVIDGGWIAQ